MDPTEEELKIELTTCGYIRELQSKREIRVIPKTLISIIIMFYQRNWKFVDKKTFGCILSKDRLSLTIESGTYSSVPFGEFFGKNDNTIYKFLIKMGRCGWCGIGFITEEFSDFYHPSAADFNMGNNHSMVLYTNGYFVTSTDFNKCGQASSTMIPNGDLDWSLEIDNIIVKINTNTMQALIWNYTVLRVEDIEFNKYDKDNKYQYMYQLPFDKKISIIINAGKFRQTIRVVNQLFYAFNFFFFFTL